MKKSWDSHLTDESIVDSAVNAQKKSDVSFADAGTTEKAYREQLGMAVSAMRGHKASFSNDYQTFQTSMTQQEEACVLQLSSPGRDEHTGKK